MPQPRVIAAVLRILNPPRRRVRWPLKAALLLVLTTLVLFPNPFLLVRNIRHWSNLHTMPEPGSPALDGLAAELNQRLFAAGSASQLAPEAVHEQVQRLVEERIPYDWDWNTWGAADYMPTVAETMAKGREDCDGRAVVAASLLQRLGYDARLVSDGSHVWVWTPEGETMSPMRTASGRTAVRATREGVQADPRAIFSWRALLLDWPKNLAYGVAVFPALRELLLLLAVWLCGLSPTATLRRALLSVVLIGGALALTKATCQDPWHFHVLWAWCGVLLVLAGVVVGARGSIPRTTP